MAHALESKRAQSPSGNRPNMSDLRIVLLGKNASENNRVGNLILDKQVFVKKKFQPDVEKHREKVEGRNITVISTIHLLSSQLSLQKIAQKVSEFSPPEPDVVILVLQHDDFSQKKRDPIPSVLNCFGEHAMKRSMVLTIDDEKRSAKQKPEDEYFQQITEECGGGRLQLRQNTPRSQILKKVDEIISGCGIKGTQQSSALDPVHTPSAFSMSKTQKLILAVCGCNEEMKASMAKLLLGKHTPISTQESTSVRVRREDKHHGRLVSLVDLPALSRLSEEEVMRQTQRVSLCDPGVHAFLLIVPAAPLTNEDKAEIEKIQKVFDSREHLIVLFTSYSIKERAQDFVKSSPSSQRLISRCGGQYRVMGLKEPENSRQIPDLLDYIEKMKTQPYSPQTYVKAQENRVRRETEERLRKMEIGKQQLIPKVGRSCPGFDRPINCDLRIVLLGKNVSESSRVRNLILGEDTFKSEASSTERQRVGRSEDRLVSIINCPQLLQTNISDHQITQTVRECVNLSDPGPHAFILVLQYKDFTEKDIRRVKHVLDEFSEEAIKRTIVLTTDEQTYMSKISSIIKNNAVREFLTRCGGGHLQLNERHSERRSEIFKMVEKILEEKQLEYLTCDIFHDVLRTPVDEEKRRSEEEKDHRDDGKSDESYEGSSKYIFKMFGSY